MVEFFGCEVESEIIAFGSGNLFFLVCVFLLCLVSSVSLFLYCYGSENKVSLYKSKFCCNR